MFNNRPSRFGAVDAVLILVGAAAAAAFFFRMNHVLDYHWNWQAIPDFFVFADPDTGAWRSNVLLDGFVLTVKISFWASLPAFFLGTVFGIMGAKGSFFQKLLSRIYVEGIRNIPSLVLVIIFYYFVSSQFLDAVGLDALIRKGSDFVRQISRILFTAESSMNAFISAVIALSMYEGAYVSEIIRGGIESVPKGQWEAAFSVGLGRKAAFVLVILPQTLRRVAFPLAGQFISTIKDSAIVSVISIQELTFQGMEMMSATFLTFEIWITITALYFILTFSLSRCINYFERRLAIRQ